MVTFFQSIKKQRINRENRNNLTVAFTFALLIGFLLAFFKIHKDKDRILNLKKEIEKSHKDKENTIMILNQYQKAIDTSYIISITDLKGLITYANDNFIALSGYKKSELIGKTHNIIRHADSPKELFHTLWKTIKDKQIWHGTIKNLHKNGTSYYVDATIFPLLDLNENITSYVAIRNDITEIKHQTDRANTILNSQNSVIIISSFVNDKMEIKQINQKFFDLFNYTDKNDFLLKHNCVCDLFIEREGYLQAIQNNKSWIEILLEEQENSYLALLKDRRQLERIFSVKAKKIDLETESFVISTFTEVTELEQARVEALSAEKAKSAFLSTMSHELRTPLNAVIGFSKILMLKKDMSAEAMKVYIAKINISGEHLLTLVNNILDYSKIDSGTIQINKQSIDLSVLINDALVLIETHANNKKIQIQKSGFINKVIEADAQLLKQVVLNILSNAVKFTPNNSKIILSYKDDEKNHLISICDEGLGLSQEQIKTIFEPFHQIETHQNQNVKGTGLGLSISKKIMQLHNGKIEVESKIGKGSCFTIYLPKSKIKDV